MILDFYSPSNLLIENIGKLLWNGKGSSKWNWNESEYWRSAKFHIVNDTNSWQIHNVGVIKAVCSTQWNPKQKKDSVCSVYASIHIVHWQIVF